MVHEHPSVTPTEAPKYAMICEDFWIDHASYATEEIRRNRFKRNIGLMQKDREKYPDRILGKMLWIRDQMHLAQFDFEESKVISNETRERAEDTLKVFRELIEANEVRFAVESLMYVNMSVSILSNNDPISTKIGIASMKSGIGSPELNTIDVLFLNTDDAKKFCDMIITENFKIYDEKYF